MTETRDVVVIGAGLGGLAAAAYLARAGLSVLVAERHDQPGGYASAFRRGPFSFEVSLHLMDAVGPGQPNRRLLEALGVDGRMTLLRPPFLRREIWPDRDLRIPGAMDAYLDLLGSCFPAERAGLGRLAEIAREACLAIDDAEGAAAADWIEPGPLSPLSALGRATAGAVAGAHVGDRRLHAMLDLFAAGWLGAPLDELPAIDWLIAWYSYHAFGGYYPEGGSAALTGALCDVVRERGGEVALEAPAARILARRGRVEGVELAGGRVVRARAVVSNASPRTTFGALLAPGAVEPRYMRRIERLAPSVSCFKIWIGTDAPLGGPGAGDYDVYLGCGGAPATGGRPDPASSQLSVVVPGALGPALVPPGRAMVDITLLMDADAWAALDDARPDARAAVADRLVGRVEAGLLPGLRERAEVVEIATPRTFERYTGNPGGCIYGASASRARGGGARLGHETPISGLYLAGAWTRPGGGFTSALRSGLLAAQRVLRSLGGGAPRPGGR